MRSQEQEGWMYVKTSGQLGTQRKQKSEGARNQGTRVSRAGRRYSRTLHTRQGGQRENQSRGVYQGSLIARSFLCGFSGPTFHIAAIRRNSSLLMTSPKPTGSTLRALN
ncbi:hypothetical protein Cadr_000016945 [Camelus dromedarius]|uniref:Uncharacterized protein n=1 Tax=Camelus dromedarius TaxID=9838 RepID=A0A5N4DG46_CAMDR|nr:hypothetical protein Cadr_000016945 [Camelus dromedarius]